MSLPSVHVAALALIDPDRRILLSRRPAGKPMAGLWEFPGGKIESGETPEDALIREIREELRIEICKPCLAPGPFVSHAYSERPPLAEPDCDCPEDGAPFTPASHMGLKKEFHLTLLLFLCRKWTGTPMPAEGQELRWVRLADMRVLSMPPADLPLLPALGALL